MTQQQHPLAPLAAYRQFITVKLVPLPNGKTDKLPVSPFGLVGVDAHNPANWQSWHEAATLAAGLGAGYTVGFVLTDADPFGCLDIDSALQPDGTWSPLSQQLCAALPGTVIEVSQSGRGLHVWFRWPHRIEHTCKNVALGIELYSTKRFVALGGGHVGELADSCPGIAAVAARFFPPRDDGGEVPDEGPRADWIGPADDDLLIQRALASQSLAGMFSGKASFADLWNGNAQALARSYPDSENPTGYDASSADMALAQHLAFWTGCDIGRTERLMRRSALVREKWDDRADYLVSRTIIGAARQAREVYRDPAEVERRARAAAGPVAAIPPDGAPSPTPGTVIASPAAAPDSLPTMRNAVSIAATSARVALDTVRQGVRELQLMIGFDEFTGRTTVQDMSVPGSVPRPLEHHDPIAIRERMGMGGAKAVSGELMRDVIDLEAQTNRHDTAVQWLQRLQWDGVPRVDTFLPTYWGTGDTPYTRAVGSYWMTALAGRVLRPGVQADMVPVLVGLQGAGKSTGIASLVPSPEFFGPLDLSERDADLCRMMSGKLIIELCELAGLRKREIEGIKAFITRRVDEWVPKFKESATKHPRRFILIGTTNEDQFLDDPTGERRWLPFEVGTVDVAAIERDREQLWAEGAARFLTNGVEWRQAQTLAQHEHGRFVVADDLAEPIAAYLARVTGPVSSEAIYLNVLRRDVAGVSRPEQQRVARVLRSLGYVKKDCRHLGLTGNPWVKVRP